MLSGEGCGSEHVEESMHLCFHFIAKLADGMMQPRRKLDRELMRCRRHYGAGDLPRSGKCIRCHSAGAQFVTERCRVLIGIVFRQQRGGLLCSVRWRFPENWQITEDRSRVFQQCKIHIMRQEHLEVTNRKEIDIVSGKRTNRRVGLFEGVEKGIRIRGLRSEGSDAERMQRIELRKELFG